jgi:hypothetical protein
MPDCASIDPLITPYVDGDIGASERQLVDQHVRACPPCHSRMAAERAVHELMRNRRAELAGETASSALRERCAALKCLSATVSGGGPSATWRTKLAPLVPLALAASVIVVVGAASVYVLTGRSSELLAAELTADHVKCFGVSPSLKPVSDPASIEREMVSVFNWHLPSAEAAAAAGMELLDARICLYGRGRAAHVMYRHNGQPVSVFMIPGTSRPEAVVDLMGHESSVWSSDGRTFVLVAREPEGQAAAVADFSRMTKAVHVAVH